MGSIEAELVLQEEAKDFWCAGKELEAGKLLYDRLPSERRPAWAASVLEACSPDIAAMPKEVQAVRAIARDRARWTEAHSAFQAVRQIVLRAERFKLLRPRGTELLYVAENVAKVTYNASNSRAPFDRDAGWWVAKTARTVVDGAADKPLEARVWAALASPRDLTFLPALAPTECQLLWTVGYHDGPLSGVLRWRERTCWFEYCVETALHRRGYVVLELSEAEIAEETKWQSLFVQHVGNHWSARPDGVPATMRPSAEHAKFYEAHAKRGVVDYSRNAVLGWFEFRGAP